MQHSVKDPEIEDSWKKELIEEFRKPYFASLKTFLVEEKKNHTVYPEGKDIFNAFNHTPLDKVRVVIIGQDPYHGPGQAHGLCFSVQKGIKLPPSLRNIYKEIYNDVGCSPGADGDLTGWANQGVLLLNATLTVRARQAGSHQKKGWENFTDKVIETVSRKQKGVVFLLWGRFAQNKATLINQSEHHILTAAHPSPFSAHNGFFGCKHFSKTNDLLARAGTKPIDWCAL